MNIELLSPAGDQERLESAIKYGADAVYLGMNAFSMRGAADYFDSPQKLESAVRFAHERGKKVYVTANTLPREGELGQYPPFLETVQDAKVDALIISDLGLLSMTRRLAPALEIHVSTQTGVTNSETCRMLYEMGVKRAVLARELPLTEIAEIRAHVPREMELEAFVHGAMCVSFSGRCLLSQYLIDRDPNRGACAQPCRWNYALVEEKRPGEVYPIRETPDGTYILNAKDMCMAEHLPELAAAGVTSMKIEGRQKSAYYVGVITNAYRTALDAMAKGEDVPAWAVRETYMVSHREYCTGFYFGRENATERYATSSYVRFCDVVAITDGWADGRLYLHQRNRFFSGDALEAVLPSSPPLPLTASDLRDSDGSAIESANHAMMACSIACETPLPSGIFLRK